MDLGDITIIMGTGAFGVRRLPLLIYRFLSDNTSNFVFYFTPSIALRECSEMESEMAEENTNLLMGG